MKNIKSIKFLRTFLIIVISLIVIFTQCKDKSKEQEITIEQEQKEQEDTEVITEEIDEKKQVRKLVHIKGYITFFIGNVEIIDNNKNSSPASLKAQLKEGYRIKTGDKSMAHVQIGTYIVLKVMDNSEMVFDSLLKDYKTLLKLNDGKVYTKITKKLSKVERFQLTTPTTTAGVRGTEFLTEYSKGKSNFIVKKGKIALYRVKDKPRAVPLNAKPDIYVNEGFYAVSEKRKKIKIEKQTRIEELELEKVRFGVEPIPEVKEKSVDYINKFNDKYKKEEKVFEKKIDRKIQDVKNEDNPKVVLELKDGSKLKGYIIEQDEKNIKLDDGKDIMLIPKSDIIRRSFGE